MQAMNTLRSERLRGHLLRGWHARLYDIVMWLLAGGNRNRYLLRIVQLAKVGRADAVLDIGCGTGSLVMATKQGARARRVHGIDASPDMVGLARKKARRRRADVTFELASAESLPFEDASFDVVFSTLMLHHLPRSAREQSAREISRVLKPAGRVLVVEFGSSAPRRGWFGRFHRHGHVAAEEVDRYLAAAGLVVVERGPIGVRDIHYTLAVLGQGG